MSGLIVRRMFKRDLHAFTQLADDADVQRLSLFVQANARGESVEYIFNKLRELHSEGYYRSYVIERAGDVLGYMSCTEQYERPNIYWLGGFVAAHARRQGIASGGRLQLMAQVRGAYEKRYKTLRPIFRTQVRYDNLPAVHMVQSIGFMETNPPKSAVHAVVPMRHFVRV